MTRPAGAEAAVDEDQEQPPTAPFARGFRLRLRHGQALHGALLPSGRCLVVEDDADGLITAAPSLDDLVRGYPDARVEWPEPSTTTRVLAWCDDLDAAVRLQHGDPQAEHPHAVALRLIIDPQEGP
ncbi:hypothetical protein ACFVDH_22020 [Streptomyces sp. NPDC057674]|uniref:hypothetical protein n=1 Tax=Streptomyces sp. NPDC057674 TaxID=3346203 RepID=UPI0036AB9296